MSMIEVHEERLKELEMSEDILHEIVKISLRESRVRLDQVEIKRQLGAFSKKTGIAVWKLQKILHPIVSELLEEARLAFEWEK